MFRCLKLVDAIVPRFFGNGAFPILWIFRTLDIPYCGFSYGKFLFGVVEYDYIWINPIKACVEKMPV